MATANPYLVPKTPILEDDAPVAFDLFSGAGGLTLGLRSAGVRVVVSSDYEKVCAATHARNFPEIPFIHDDVHKLNGDRLRKAAGIGEHELDILAGGPPCQGFSIIGTRQFEDPRNSLFKQFMRIASELQPKVILIENVPGLATLERGRVLDDIARAFDEVGYAAQCAELLAAQYGVPQMRWRMVFLGWRKDLKKSGGFPLPTHGHLGIGDLVPNRTVTERQQDGFLRTVDAIGDLPPVDAGQTVTKYTEKPARLYQRAMRDSAPRQLANHYAPKLSVQNLERIEHLLPGQDWRSLPHDLLPESMKRALRKDHTRRFRRMTWDGVPRSIITRFRDPKSGEYIHPTQTRTISIREAARIQSFPDWFVFEGANTEQYVQVGNAVPPLLGKAIGLSLRAALAAPTAREASVKSRYRLPELLYPVAQEA